MATSLGDTAADAEQKRICSCGCTQAGSTSSEAAKADSARTKNKVGETLGDMPKADSGKQKQAGVDDDRFMQQQQQLAVVEPQAALPNQQTI